MYLAFQINMSISAYKEAFHFLLISDSFVHIYCITVESSPEKGFFPFPKTQIRFIVGLILFILICIIVLAGGCVLLVCDVNVVGGSLRSVEPGESLAGAASGSDSCLLARPRLRVTPEAGAGWAQWRLSRGRVITGPQEQPR